MIAIFFTKRNEREVEWRGKKLAYYEEFFGAASGIVGETSPPDTIARRLHGSFVVVRSAGLTHAPVILTPTYSAQSCQFLPKPISFAA